MMLQYVTFGSDIVTKTADMFQSFYNNTGVKELSSYVSLVCHSIALCFFKYNISSSSVI